MSWFYGKVGDTILRSGISEMDLDFDTREEFETYVEGLLIKAKEYIDFYTNNEFEENEEDRSALVDDIAERIASRMLNIATKDQTNQIVDVNEFNAQLVDDSVINNAIRKDLDLLPTGQAKVKSRGSISVGIIKDEDDFDFYQDIEIE